MNLQINQIEIKEKTFYFKTFFFQFLFDLFAFILNSFIWFVYESSGTNEFAYIILIFSLIYFIFNFIKHN